MYELSVMDGFCNGIQCSIAELRHLLLAEGLPLLSEELGDHVFLDVAGVVPVEGPEGGQEILVSSR